ncbi:MAG: hypothetical protein ACRDMI_17965 [Streptosporangiaceae bacterium]
MSGTDFVGEATTELYGSDPEGFTERRAALAAQARAAGDRPAAKEIAGLRKPTRPAWMINQLVRADPGVADRLVQLGDELRAAAAALDGTKIRELSQERRRLVDSLIRQALQHAGEQAPSAALREDLTATFGAALADPQVARELAAGTLLRPVHRADFSPGLPGLALVPPPAKASGGTAKAAGASEVGEAEEGARVAAGPQAAGPQAAGPRAARAAGKARTAQPGKAADRPKAAGQARDQARVAEEARAAREAKAAEEARAAEKAWAAEKRRQAIADAEQAVAEASRAADQAAQDERDERDTIWGLEDQLDEARRRLSATRRRVRETQSAQQKARRALSRLKDTSR